MRAPRFSPLTLGVPLSRTWGKAERELFWGRQDGQRQDPDLPGVAPRWGVQDPAGGGPRPSPTQCIQRQRVSCRV